MIRRRIFRSIRLRLLFMALAPLVLLMPLLLLLGMTRWTADYDKLLIANVASDLRIAEQYLARLMTVTGDELTGTAESVGFARVLTLPEASRAAYFEQTRQRLNLDFLYYLPEQEARDDAARWPVIVTAMNGTPSTAIDIFGASDLMARSPALTARARIDLIDTRAAVPTDRTIEERGMVVHAAAPVSLPGHKGVLVGGILLNRNLDFIDTINALVYLNAVTGGDRQGTATLFLDDVRVSTNVRLFEDVRALGTRVSAVVRQAVLGEGRTWLDRAFVVNDWYISGYLPLRDSYDQPVGMLYVGFLEAPFSTAKRQAVIAMLGAFFIVLLLSAPLFLWLAKGIFSPLESMTRVMNRVKSGNLAARNALPAKDEIGQVAGHLDDLLDQVQDRDARLRAWADQLEQRVEMRTTELKEANAKLEDTWRQLVASEKLASIGEITAGVAHEINNPVAVIQGNMDVMREALGDEAMPVKTEMDLIDKQVSRINAIVGKLLQFARPVEFSGAHSRVALEPVLRDCLLLVGHELDKSAIRVETDLNPVPDVAIDPGEMQQVTINLLVNAVHALEEAGTIALTLRPEIRNGTEGAVLVVRDTGPGIPDTLLDTVFDPFFTTKIGEGTGLGLSISQTLISRAGGRISYRNPEGGGAEFTVWLPAAQD